MTIGHWPTTEKYDAPSRGPRLFDSNRPVAFIHIGKNAGSSMNAIFTKAKNLLRFYYVGGKHFDFPYARKKLPNAQEKLEW